MKILLLEDNIALNKAIKKVLELDGHEVVPLFDGQAVFDRFDDSYNLYILDINVPHISGLELLRMINKENNLAKIIIISSNTDLDSLQEAYRLGCVDYLKKPFHIEELRIKIKKIDIPRKHLASGIKLKDDVIGLTKSERTLLNLLLENQKSVVTYAMIEELIYADKIMSMDSLRALIKRLRAKLAEDCIHNVIDEGYSISNTPLFFNENLQENVKQRVRELEIENKELKLQKELLVEVSSKDPLTGLFNRIKIEEIFLYEQAQSIRYANQLSVVLMDLDDFKVVNDTYGHNVGDIFLKEISMVLQTTFRSTDIIGRWGGEEFLILLPKTSLKDAKELVNKFRGTIETTRFSVVGHKTASFGVAALLENESLIGIIERVDEALYLAKDYGKNRVEVVN